MHSFWRIIEATKTFPGGGAFDHLEWTYDGEFELFSASGGGNLNKNFPKIKKPRGGDVQTSI